MKNLRTIMLAGITSLSLLAACGGEVATPTADLETQREVANTRAALKQASAAARAYGQAHLGHFRDLGTKQLQREGLRVPDSVAVSVRTTHTAFCIVVANDALPSIHPWARGSVSSRHPSLSSKDGCRR